MTSVLCGIDYIIGRESWEPSVLMNMTSFRIPWRIRRLLESILLELCNVRRGCGPFSEYVIIVLTIIILSLPDWSDEAVSNAEILRLIYQGRFLHCNVTLSALGLATGKTTVMHLVPRENLPEPNSQGSYFNSKIRKSPYFVVHCTPVLLSACIKFTLLQFAYKVMS